MFEGKLVHKELSCKIVWVMFNVFRQIGAGHPEKVYQKAISNSFLKLGIGFKEQIPCDLICDGLKVGRYYFDFLVEDKIVVEIKRNYRLRDRDYQQIKGYLSALNLDLGLLVLFNYEGASCKRVLNIYR
jgi:GxxExxY protein